MTALDWLLAKKLHCPHTRVRPIYGDEIIFGTPHFARNECLDCGRFLDGPPITDRADR